MKRIKMKALTVALGSALLLGAGLNAYAADNALNDKGKSGSVGQFVDDATITTRVKAKFASDSTVSATRIKVDTVKGVVELSGKVSSEAESDQAVALAKGIPDVRGVRNNLTIEVPTSRTPARTNSPS